MPYPWSDAWVHPFKAAELNFCHVLGKENTSFLGKSGCLSINNCSDNEISKVWDTHSHENNTNMLDVSQKYIYPLSIIFFDTRDGNKLGEVIVNFLQKGITSGHFLMLQFLDLEDVYMPRLPNSIGELIHLIYLGLRRTYLKAIPSWIGNLLYWSSKRLI